MHIAQCCEHSIQLLTAERLEIIYECIGSKSVPVLKRAQQDTIRLHKSLHTELNILSTSALPNLHKCVVCNTCAEMYPDTAVQ